MVRALVMPLLSCSFASAKNFDVVFEGAREECAGSFTGAREWAIPILVSGG